MCRAGDRGVRSTHTPVLEGEVRRWCSTVGASVPPGLGLGCDYPRRLSVALSLIISSYQQCNQAACRKQSDLAAKSSLRGRIFYSVRRELCVCMREREGVTVTVGKYELNN
jgi:hypothetical protein